MNQPEPANEAQSLRPHRQSASGDKEHNSRAVLVDEKWRAWVFYEKDTGPRRQPAKKTVSSRVTP